MRENSFNISSKLDREIVLMPTQNIIFLKLHCSHIYLAHLQGYSRKCNTKFNKLLWILHFYQSNALR